MTCPLPEYSPPPILDAKAEGDRVYIEWQKARDLASWIGAVVRWHDTAQVCLDAQSGLESGLRSAVTDADYERKIRESGVDKIVKGMTLRGMQVTVNWETCGEVNGYYFYRLRTLTLCRELLDVSPAFTRFVAAHEMAHAIIWQLDIPYTGNGEVAADELASVVLGLTGSADDVTTTALVFKNLGGQENPYSSHPSHMRRYVTLGRLALGAKGEAFTEDWDRVIAAWARLLRGHR